MKIENNKIVEATEDELYQHWLDNFSHIYPFYAYRYALKQKGVKIVDSKRHDNKRKLRRDINRVTKTVSNK